MERAADELRDEGYEPVGPAGQIAGVMPRRVDVGGRSVLLCREGDRVFAVDEICPHKERSMVYGIIHGGKLICPHHQYGFELETGRCDQRRCAPVQTYPTAVTVDGELWVKVG